MNPRKRHSQLPYYQPVSPPMIRIGTKACSGVRFTDTLRCSTRRFPNFTPPHVLTGPAEDKESDQRVSFEYCSSFCRTLEIASRMPTGRKSKSVNASLFFTTVG